MTIDMFPDLPAPTAVEPEPSLSADRRRTLRQKQAIENGRHPLSNLSPGLRLLAGSEETCGSCAHRVLVGHHTRSYPKCVRISTSHGASSDCRAWWPACTAWTAA